MATSRPIFDQGQFYSALHAHVLDTECQFCGNVPAETKATFWNSISLRMRMAISQAEEDFLSQRESLDGDFDFSFLPATGSSEPAGPYHEVEAADVIIRSSDGKGLRFHKSILAIFSPFFRDMFSLPSDEEVPSSSPGGQAVTVDGLPQISVTEHSVVLEGLSPWLYPNTHPQIESYDLALHLLAAAQKYQMDGAMRHIRSILSNPREPPVTRLQGSLFRAYAIAAKSRLAQETKFLAVFTLNYPLTFKGIGQSLRYVEGSALYALLQYRKRCRDAIASRLDSILNVSSRIAKEFLQCPKQIFMIQPQKDAGNVKVEFERCKTLAPNSEANLPLWWYDFLSRLLKDVVSDTKYPSIKSLGIEKLFNDALAAHYKAESVPLCLMCAMIYNQRGARFCTALNKDLKDAIESVHFELPWPE
ncbi:hypothetical protein BC834DRAFT_271364 [Gloeopeniophorella convolvens]|nr:hypothetical protein BC834DRAFT_271364 [Gloeopeniophorella convolvens]